MKTTLSALQPALLSALLLCSLTNLAIAGTGLNCSEVINKDSSDNELEACIEQTNDELNSSYKQLRVMYKESKDHLAALKKMQLGWIEMRNGQCDFESRNSAGGGGAARTAVRCEIRMTLQRTDELDEMLK